MQSLKLPTVALVCAAFAAAQPCSPADLRGNYLFKTWGTHDLGPSHPYFPGATGPTYGLGVVDLDGAGKGSGRLNVTFGGVSQSFEFADFAYTMAENCAGTAEYRLKASASDTVLGPDKLEIRLLNDGALLRGIVLDSPGRAAVLAVELRRLGRSPRACLPGTLRGSYTMFYDGAINLKTLNPSLPAAFSSFFGVGTFTFDPESGNRGSAVGAWGSLRVWTDLVAGAWNLNSDCTGIFEFTMQPRGTPNRISAKNPFVLSEDGARATVLMLDPPGLQSYERVSIP